MNVLMRTQKMLSATCCPNCGTGDFDLQLRCDQGADECLYTATCPTCSERFTISRPDEDHGLEQPCRVCGSGQLDGVLQCESVSHQCHVVMQCDYCAATSTHLAAA